MARREERAYREYVSDEQRSQPRGPQRGSRVGVEEGCPARELCDESLLRDTSSPWCNSICIRAALHPAHHRPRCDDGVAPRLPGDLRVDVAMAITSIDPQSQSPN